MYQGRTIGVVVPAYNEEGFVGTVIETMPDFVDRIYVVDDCSTDGTWAEIQEHATGEQRTGRSTSDTNDSVVAGDRIVPIQHEENRGAGGAIKTGYLHALADGVDVTVTVDADGQMDPNLMARFVDPIVEGRADYAKGNRLANAEFQAEMPRFRLLGNWMLTFLTQIASGYWRTRDPQNGYTAISIDALEAVDVEEMYEYYGYCNDLLVKLNAAGMRVADVPMPATYGDEESSIKYGEYIPNVSGMLFRNFLWRLRTRYLSRDLHPLAAFYGLGFLSVPAGVLYALVTASRADGSFVARLGEALLVLAIGAVFIVTAMVLDRHENRNLEVTVE